MHKSFTLTLTLFMLCSSPLLAGKRRYAQSYRYQYAPVVTQTIQAVNKKSSSAIDSHDELQPEVNESLQAAENGSFAPVSLSLASDPTDVDCQSGQGEECDKCKSGRNPPHIQDNGHCDGDKDCTEITPPNPVGKPQRIPGKVYEFYKPNPIKIVNVKVPAPVIVKDEYKVREFTTYTYTVDCCEYTVCIPCKDCCEERNRCTNGFWDKALVTARQLTSNGNWDIYVSNVPGMPDGWLLYRDATKSDIQEGQIRSRLP